jgi:VWFA-related protein
MRSIALLTVLLTIPVLAQPIFDDAVTINIVDVPVYVERSGIAVQGLTRNDFELFVGGKRYPIEYFDVIDEGRAAADSASSAQADLRRRRLIVLLFDLGASPYSLQRARLAAMESIADGAEGDTFAVATIGRSSVQFLSAFTNDRVAVQRAIATLKPSEAGDPFRVATLAAERAKWSETANGAEGGAGAFSDIWGDDVAPGGIGVSSAAANARAFERTVQEMERREEESLTLEFIENLTALAERLSPLEGVKQIVLLSERALERDGQGPVLQRSTRLHARYRAAGVILNAVDIQPPRVPAGSAIATSPSPVARSRTPNVLTSHFLHALAADTGGSVTASLPQLLDRNRHAYVIGFRAPEGSTRDSIRVEVKNVPRLTDVRYRKSYDLGLEKTADKGLFLADTLLNDIPQHGVTLDLIVKGTEVTASIPGVELLSYGSGKPVGLEVFFYVFDEEGRPFSWNALQIAVDLEKGRDFLSAHPYTLRQDLALQPGRYVVKALVRIGGTDRVGFERAGLVVPAS